MTRPRLAVCLLTAVALLLGAASAPALRKASHRGWPPIDGGLFINKHDESRPLDMRAGHDPFGGTDPTYSCDGEHKNQQCLIDAGACQKGRKTRMCAATPVMPANARVHHELLGGHGNDTIHGGDAGDVIWADHKYAPQPLTQRDTIFGGRGKDFIYGSHGHNEIHTGGGADLVNVRYGRGVIYCDSTTARVNFSRRSRKRFVLHGCKIVTMKAIGTFEDGG